MVGSPVVGLGVNYNTTKFLLSSQNLPGPSEERGDNTG